MAPPIPRDMLATALPDRPVELPQSLPELATRAMRRFRCVGPACEDTCCRDFGIHIDRAGLERMRAAVAHEPEQREKVVHLVVLGMPTPGGEPARNLVQLDDHGGCPMLDADGGCGVHRRHGEGALGTACSVFPRTSLAVEHRLEVTGSLACPELTRLSLLADDGLEQDPGAEPVLPRAYVGKNVETDTTNLYGSAFSRTRATLIDIFRRDGFTLGTRFAFAANLAAELDDFFLRDARSVGPAEALLFRRRLDAELAATASPEGLTTVRADLGALPESPPVVVAAAATLLAERLRLTHAPRFGALVRDAFLSLGGHAAGDHAPTLDATRARAALRERRAIYDALAPGLLDRLLGRYAHHYLLRYPYTDRPSLLAYLNRLGTSLAAIRFLWLGSPRLWALLAPPPAINPAEAARAITQVGLEVIQSFTKAVSHHVEFQDAIHEADEQPGGVRFGRLALLARFV